MCVSCCPPIVGLTHLSVSCLFTPDYGKHFAHGIKLNHKVANYNIRDDLGDPPSAPTIHIYKMTQDTTPLLFHLEIQIAGSNLLDLSPSPYVQHLGVN